METKNIQDFLALAELGSSYAAAEKLFVSQSTLVRHIQAIEDEFGMALFDRTRAGFVLNEAGRIFLPYAKKIAFAQRQCYAALHRDEEENNVIKITAFGKIIDLLLDFKKKYPQYSIEYHHPQNAEMQLREGLLDVAFMAKADNEDDELVQIPFMKIRLLAVVYSEHPLAQKDVVSLEELKDEPIISIAEDITFSGMFMEFYEREGFVPNITATVPLGRDVLKMVKEKLGITIIHGSYANATEEPGLKVLDIQPNADQSIDMCYRRDARMSKSTEAFVNYAKRWKLSHKDVDLSLLQ